MSEAPKGVGEGEADEGLDAVAVPAEAHGWAEVEAFCGGSGAGVDVEGDEARVVAFDNGAIGGGVGVCAAGDGDEDGGGVGGFAFDGGEFRGVGSRGLSARRSPPLGWGCWEAGCLVADDGVGERGARLGDADGVGGRCGGFCCVVVGYGEADGDADGEADYRADDGALDVGGGGVCHYFFLRFFVIFYDRNLLNSKIMTTFVMRLND